MTHNITAFLVLGYKNIRYLTGLSGNAAYMLAIFEHGLGLFLHVQPFINSHVEHTLAAGNIITVELGLYVPGCGDARLEDDILITTTGFEVLTHAPKPLELEI